MIKDLEMGRLSWIIQMGSKRNPMCPYKREATLIKREIFIQRGEGDMKTAETHLRILAVKTGMVWSQAKGCQGLPEAEDARKGWSPGVFGGSTALPVSRVILMLDSDLQNGERISLCCFKPPSVW